KVTLSATGNAHFANIDRPRLLLGCPRQTPAGVLFETEGIVVRRADRQHGQRHFRLPRPKKAVGDFVDCAVAAGRADAGESGLGSLPGQLVGVPRSVRRLKLGPHGQRLAQALQTLAGTSPTGLGIVDDAQLFHGHEVDSTWAGSRTCRMSPSSLVGWSGR